MKFTQRKFGSLMLIAACSMMLSACPLQPQPGEGDARVLMLLGNDGGKALAEALLKQGGGPVNVADIASLTVTITDVRLTPAGAASGGPGISVFAGAADVELMSLLGVSALLSEAVVPPGEYSRIALSISNPRLVLHSDPGVVRTDIHLTAAGRVFVETPFSLPAGQTSLVLLDFQSLHLVQQGHGGFVLTPQLRADIAVMSAEIVMTGTIVEVNAELGLVVVALPEGEVQVFYAGAVVFLPGDTDVPTGVVADLVVGLEIEVTGLLQVTGDVSAEVIIVL